MAAGISPSTLPTLSPIATPLLFSGLQRLLAAASAPLFNQMGVAAAQGGAGSTVSTKPAADWKSALQPGQTVAGVLVSGDMGVTGLGTVTYNDGKRILAFGHPFFNIGPVDMPMSKGEVLMVLGFPVSAEQDRQRDRNRRRAASGPPQRHHGRAGR